VQDYQIADGSGGGFDEEKSMMSDPAPAAAGRHFQLAAGRPWAN
jgi:hypothetical protein